MKTAKGFTPIQYAQSLGLDEIVRLLSLRQQTELNQSDPEGYTPFSKYVLSSKFEMAIRLLHKGADINFTNPLGKTALVQAVESENFPATKFLLEKGADPHIEDIKGKDACDYAKSASDYLAFSQLLPACQPDKRTKSLQYKVRADRGLIRNEESDVDFTKKMPKNFSPKPLI